MGGFGILTRSQAYARTHVRTLIFIFGDGKDENLEKSKNAIKS